MSVINPAGVFGESAFSPKAQIVRPYHMVTTVTAGNVVAASTSTGRGIACLTNTGQKAQLGIAVENIAAGSVGLVCIYGPFYGAKKDTASAVTAQDVVTRAATDTGGVAPLAGTTAVTQYKDVGLGIGIVLADAVATATVCDIFVGKF